MARLDGIKNWLSALLGLVLLLGGGVSLSGEEDELERLRRERTDILQFGIDSEVLSLLTTLRAEKTPEFNELILEQASKTVNQDLVAAALDLFKEVNFAGAQELALGIIQDYNQYRTPVLLSGLAYLKSHVTPRHTQAVLALLGSSNEALLLGAIDYVGSCGDENQVVTLLDLYEDSRTPENAKPAVLSALGNLGFPAASERLTEIAVDPYERAANRWYAAQALGKIGEAGAFTALQGLLGDPDPNLRSYVVEAVGRYPQGEDVLIEALRDSFWRVRLSAARQLGERGSERAVDILIYKAKNDPENNVRNEAISALGKIGRQEGFETLREMAEARATLAPAVWAQAVQVLIQYDLRSSLPAIEKIIDEEFAGNNPYFLNHIGRLLSEKADAPYLADIYGKFMDHPSLIIKIYGIRGAELNQITGLRSRITELSGEANHLSVRQAARRALENL
ncbi:MAG: HEAT repeat domain-containing protein [Spirochaetales bacterium]|jgi:hypothetical protein|nr:HEAT repeat domain-containing protein [Spirochaetales bacterium]